MLRYLSQSNHIPKAVEELLAVCLLEDVSFESVASEEMQDELKQVLESLRTLAPAMRRELALSSLEDLLV